MDIEERIDLILRNIDEVVTREELRSLLESNDSLKAYWGFECSGFMHIGIGLIPGTKVKDMVNAGFEFTIFLADWHTWINNKLSGLMENIRASGDYFRHCFNALGVISDNTRVVWAADIAEDIEYWEKVVRVAKASTLLRVHRALTIMGRDMDLKDVETAWLFYPCMQVADIFHLDVNVACGGMDQRKAHMLARDTAEKLGWKKPICLHTPLLLGLIKDEVSRDIPKRFDEDADMSRLISSKMSKSKPESCIFVHDKPKIIRQKISSAYCPPKQEKRNPVLEHAKYIVFPKIEILELNRPSKYGGPIIFESYEELRQAYLEGKVHPQDLKNGIADALVEILEPVREHFKKYPEPLEKMMKIVATR